MIKVAVSGCFGRMGSAVIDAVSAADDMEVACGIDPFPKEGASFTVYSSMEEAVAGRRVRRRRRFHAAERHRGKPSLRAARRHRLRRRHDGLSDEKLTELAALAPSGTCLFYAPNFTTGAVLMMEFAKAAAPYFPEAEVIEMHHCNKKDAPSGTAMRTAQIISDARGGRASEAPGAETELPGAEGARGALVSGVPVHSVRSMGFVASQEVVFGSMGQTLTIRHDSWDRASYMPGVLLGIRSVGAREGLIVGLENFMHEA